MTWFHRLFNPHCPECNHCNSCDTLMQQLAQANDEKRKLLDTIIELNRPIVVAETPRKETEEVKPRAIPWRVKKELLEAEDRAKAKVLAEQKEVERLEKELGVDNASDIA